MQLTPPRPTPDPPAPKDPPPTTGQLTVAAGRLYDPTTLSLLSNQIIYVSQETGFITNVVSARDDTFPELKFSDPSVIDFRKATVLPGFVDVHVHFFLHPYSEASWEDQLTKESLVERTLRASLHARKTLMAGFTTVRDLGTEGAGDADIHLRKCLSGPKPLIPGPRYFCANRAIVPTGSYGPKSSIHINQEGIDGITGAEVADGEDECLKAVRRQVSAGADWIKIYADYRVLSRIAPVAPLRAQASVATFTSRELEVLIRTAHHYGVKIAAHATNEETIRQLQRLGVDSVEHGYDIAHTISLRTTSHHPWSPRNTFDDEDTDISADPLPSLWPGLPDNPPPTTWVPTLAAAYTTGRTTGAWAAAQTEFKRALRQAGFPTSAHYQIRYRNGHDPYYPVHGAEALRIACGGDTGVFAHGDNALEMQLMAQLGAPWSWVLRWATLGGYECIRAIGAETPPGGGSPGYPKFPEVTPRKGDNEVAFGRIAAGWSADLVATKGDVESGFENAVAKDSILFVMRSGKVCKWEGREVV